MATERIETLISKEALGQFDELNAKLALSVVGFEKLVAKGVEVNKVLGGAKTFKQVVDGTKELEAAEKSLAKANDDLAKNQAKLQALYTEEAKKLAELKVQQQEQNKLLKEQAKEALGLNDAYARLSKEYDVAAKEAKNLAVQFGAQSKQAQEASKKVLELDQRLKAADANVGRFNKNVGNYSGALKTLEGALTDVTKKIDDYNKSGNQNKSVLQALEKEQGLLRSLVDAQSQGFKTATSEIRGNTQAIQQLSQIYGEDSAIVQALVSDTAKLTDEVGDLRAKVKAQASDTKVFDGLINAAQGLAGVYTIAQGASALFGDENEELQKTFVKLQAAMAVLQGLQAIQNVLQKESQARQLVTLGLQKIAVLQTNLETAAQSKNIIVKYAAIAAQKALNVALSLAGGPLLAVIGLLALVVVSLSSFSMKTEEAAKSFDRLSAEFERDKNALDDYAQSVKQNGEEIIASMESQFASEEKIRKQRVQNLRDQLQATIELESQNRSEAARTQKFLEDLAKKSQTSDLSDDEKDQIDQAEKFLNDFKSLAKQRQELASQIRVTIVGNEKATKEESIKARQDDLETLKTQLQLRAGLVNSVAADERKGFDERIKALEEFGQIQQRIINADAKKQLLTPGQTPSQIKLIEANRSAAIVQSRRESQKQIEDLTRQFAERERRAQFDIARTQIEVQANAAQEVATNQEKTLEERLFAALEFQKAQEALVTGQKNLELSSATLTAKERQAIEDKANADILASKIAFNKQVQEITLAELDEENRIRVANNNKERDESVAALNERFNAGKISLAEYNHERLNLEKAYTLEALDIEINNIQKVIDEYKKQGKDVSELEAQLAEFQKQKSDEVTNKKIDDLNKLHALQKQLAGEAFEFVKGIFDAQITNQKNEVQEQIDQLDKKKEKDIETANASIQNEQERAAAIQTINLRAQAQKEALERRQRQLDLERARFEKLANISSIIANTASAIVKQLVATPLPAGLPFVLTIGSIGALQLARAIAAPLPKFAEGTLDAPGGLSVVGDGGKKELVVTPGGQLIETPDIPTVMNVPKHSIVFPDLKMLQAGMFINNHGRLVDNGSDIQALGHMLGGKIDQLNKTIKSKKEIHVRGKVGKDIMLSIGGNETRYLNNNLQG